DEEEAEFEELCEQVASSPLLLDVVVSEEVGRLAGDCQDFFLFEESIRAMLLALLRDTRVASRLAAPPLTALHAASAVQAVPVPPPRPLGACRTATTTGAAGADSGGGGGDVMAANGGGGGSSSSTVRQTAAATSHWSLSYYPPSGVLPYRGLSLLAAPLCYLYDNPASSYRLFRAMYCRYWCKLHSLSTSPPPTCPALPGLLRVFEEIMQALDPLLLRHLQRLGLLPGALVAPWMCSGFAGALPVQEVLLLWDRIIGLDSLLPLPLLAAAVLCFRRPVLLSCGSPREVMAALGDISQLGAVPLMQAVLFPG
ncbi:hypothetical protein Agub_g11625, partial [Astrephomene gubernaculifera]